MLKRSCANARLPLAPSGLQAVEIDIDMNEHEQDSDSDGETAEIEQLKRDNDLLREKQFNNEQVCVCSRAHACVRMRACRRCLIDATSSPCCAHTAAAALASRLHL